MTQQQNSLSPINENIESIHSNNNLTNQILNKNHNLGKIVRNLEIKHKSVSSKNGDQIE